MPQFASKAEEKNYYERQASLEEFLTWYHQQELPLIWFFFVTTRKLIN